MLVGALALALCEADARAGWWPPERPPTSVEDPWDTRWTLEASDRLRGEFVDFFAQKPGSKTPNFRYNFLGNKFQAGVRVRRDPWEAFVQFQHTVLDDVPVDGAGPGGSYFANTKRSFPGARLAAPGLGARRGPLRREGRGHRCRAPAVA